MFKSLSPFGKKQKTKREFKDYYREWIETVETTHLPLIRHHMSTTAAAETVAAPNLLSAHVQLLHHHFQTYYQTLDAAASNDVAQVLFPTWRNSLEKPFLWLGDFHPYLFTSLLRSFLLQNDSVSSSDAASAGETGTETSGGVSEIEIGESCEFLAKQWPLINAWKAPSRDLTARIDQIERGLRLIVPALADRARKSQSRFIEKVAGDESAVAEAAAAEMEEMLAVVTDANRLRRDVIAEIVSITSVYQAALFLEGLAQFLVGFRDQELLREFKSCKTPIN